MSARMSLFEREKEDLLVEDVIFRCHQQGNIQT